MIKRERQIFPLCSSVYVPNGQSSYTLSLLSDGASLSNWEDERGPIITVVLILSGKLFQVTQGAFTISGTVSALVICVPGHQSLHDLHDEASVDAILPVWTSCTYC